MTAAEGPPCEETTPEPRCCVEGCVLQQSVLLIMEEKGKRDGPCAQKWNQSHPTPLAASRATSLASPTHMAGLLLLKALGSARFYLPSAEFQGPGLPTVPTDISLLTSMDGT